MFKVQSHKTRDQSVNTRLPSADGCSTRQCFINLIVIDHNWNNVWGLMMDAGWVEAVRGSSDHQSQNSPRFLTIRRRVAKWQRARRLLTLAEPEVLLLICLHYIAIASVLPYRKVGLWCLCLFIALFPQPGGKYEIRLLISANGGELQNDLICVRVMGISTYVVTDGLINATVLGSY